MRLRMSHELCFLFLLFSSALVIGCTSQENVETAKIEYSEVFKDVPPPVLQKYNELKRELDYSQNSRPQSGVWVKKCMKSEMIYVVTGSNGYAGESHYYTKTGDLIASWSFGDVVVEHEDQRPPVDVSDYECETLIKN